MSCSWRGLGPRGAEVSLDVSFSLREKALRGGQAAHFRKEKKMKGMTDLLKMAQKAQQDIAAVQEELANKTVEAAVGGGMVIAKANGRQQIVEITIKPEVVDPKDIEMLQELVLAAVNEALRRSQAMANEEMSKITGNLKIPGVFGG